MVLCCKRASFDFDFTTNNNYRRPLRLLGRILCQVALKVSSLISDVIRAIEVRGVSD